MEFERKKRRHTHIDIAPLVDVVFLLLLFFMLTFHIVSEPAIKIRLPESQTAEAREKQEIILFISDEGNTYIGEKPVSLEDIPQVVQEALKEGRDRAVHIKADRNVPVSLLVKVIDGVKRSGCNAFSIVTKRE